jgi:hypothetical protein
MQRSRTETSLREGHPQRSQREGAIDRRLHRPADEPPRAQIPQDGQIEPPFVRPPGAEVPCSRHVGAGDLLAVKLSRQAVLLNRKTVLLDRRA